MKTITRQQYYQLAGLLVLAKRHNDARDEIQRAAQTLVDEEDASGWVSDAVAGGIGDYNADDLLRRMKIEVVD